MKNRYGTWNVLGDDPNDSKRALCRCDCGTERSVSKHSLHYGRSTSCGCSRRNVGVIDEVGNRYGRLYVVKRAPSKPSGAAFECLCDCGNTTIVLGGHLRAGTTSSCGCYKRDFLDSLKTDLTGETFGKLTVIARLPDEDNPNKVGKWRCKCECGNEHLVNQRELVSDKTKSCGCLDESYSSFLINKKLGELEIQYEKEHKYNDLIGLGGGPLRYDWRIFTKEGYFLLEYDGEQHFLDSNRYWNPRLVEHDKMKDEYAKKIKINLYRINYKQEVEKELMTILKKEGLINE